MDQKTKNVRPLIRFAAIAVLLLGLHIGIFISETGSRLVFLASVLAFAVLSVINYKANAARMVWVLSIIIVYAGSHLVWSNAALFEPDLGARVAVRCTFISAYISVAACYFDKRWLACLTAFGYNFGVIASGLWGEYSFAPGGGLLHNGDRIWFFIFLGFIAVGGIIEILRNDWGKAS